MSLVRFSNSYPFSLNRLFDNEVLNGSFSSNQNNSVPAVNIKETADGFTVLVAAPGYEKSDFKLELNRNVLTIATELNAEAADKDNYTHREFNYQSFVRRFSLPSSADGDHIEASYVNGILHVSIPKREEAKPKPARMIAIA